MIPKGFILEISINTRPTKHIPIRFFVRPIKVPYKEKALILNPTRYGWIAKYWPNSGDVNFYTWMPNSNHIH